MKHLQFKFSGIFSLLLLLLVGAGVVSLPATAQTINATLGGIVADPTGARIPGATVMLINQATKGIRKVTSNGEGLFVFSSIPAGTYTLKITEEGFETFLERDIELNPNDDRRLNNIAMKIGKSATTVIVKAQSQDAVNVTGERGSLITSEDISRLSTEGRDVSELLGTQPGFSMYSTGLDNQSASKSVVGSYQGMGNFVGNGSPANGASMISDGANVTDPGNESGQTQTVNMDMVAEVKIDASNFGADTAKGPIVITAVGKSGSQNYHGSVYAYGRTAGMNAEDWFFKYEHLPKIDDHYIYPGFSISGPVPSFGTSFNHDKKLVFWIGGEDYIQRNVYSYGNAFDSFIAALVPTQNMRNGDFSQAELANYLGTSVSDIVKNCNPTSSSTLANFVNICWEPDGSGYSNGQLTVPMDPGAKAMMSVIPLPTQPTVNDVNWTTENLENVDSWQARTRVDYAMSDNNKIYGVFDMEPGNTTHIPEQIYYSPAGSSANGMGGIDTPGKLSSKNTSNTGNADYTHIFNHALTNEVFAAVSYVANYFSADDESALLRTTINYPYSGIYPNASKQYPQLDDYGHDGLPLGLFPDFSNGDYKSRKFLPNAGDNLTWVLGSHTLKFGTYGERIVADQTDLNAITNGEIQQYYLGTTITDATGTHAVPQCIGSGCHGNYLADFMLGDIDTFVQESFNPNTNLYYWNVDFFGTDTWQVTKALTLDYGLRVEHYGPWTDSHSLGIAVFEPSLYAQNQAQAFSDCTTTVYPYGTNSTYILPKNCSDLPGLTWHARNSSIPKSGAASTLAFLSPRFGVAYDVFGNGKTVLRGGWGAYRSHDSWNDFSPAAATAQGVVLTQVGGSGITLAGVDASGGNGNSSTLGGSFSALDPTDSEQPVTYNYSFTIAQNFPRNAQLQVAYVGNQSSHLLTDNMSTTIDAGNIQNVNAIKIGGMFQPDPNQFDGPSYNQVLVPQSASAQQQDDFRPYPFYGTLLVPRHIAYANYNGLQASFTKQRGALVYGLNYTWSKALGIRGAYNNGWSIDPTNLRNNYGPLVFDRSQVIAATYSYSHGAAHVENKALRIALSNWMISGITNWQTGPNLQAAYSPDFNLQGTIGGQGGTNTATANVTNLTMLGTPDVVLQPKLTCNPTQGLHARQFVNGNCFALEPYGVNGPSNFPYVHGPAYFNSDLTLQRQVELGGSRNLQFRVAGFNFLNHPLVSFTSRFPNEVNLFLNGATAATTTLGSSTTNCSQDGSNCFGYAGYKEGRRVVELSVKYNY